MNLLPARAQIAKLSKKAGKTVRPIPKKRSLDTAAGRGESSRSSWTPARCDTTCPRKAGSDERGNQSEWQAASTLASDPNVVWSAGTSAVQSHQTPPSFGGYAVCADGTGIPDGPGP
jgi:hypothetical protein